MTTTTIQFRPDDLVLAALTRRSPHRKEWSRQAKGDLSRYYALVDAILPNALAGLSLREIHYIAAQLMINVDLEPQVGDAYLALLQRVPLILGNPTFGSSDANFYFYIPELSLEEITAIVERARRWSLCERAAVVDGVMQALAICRLRTFAEPDQFISTAPPYLSDAVIRDILEAAGLWSSLRGME